MNDKRLLSLTGRLKSSKFGPFCPQKGLKYSSLVLCLARYTEKYNETVRIFELIKNH